MSYQSQKNKRSKINKINFYFGVFCGRFFKNDILRRGKMKQFVAIKKLTDFLRERSKLLRVNNLRVNEWVDGYLRECFVNGQPVNILTPWCVSKSFERRLREQGRKFLPTKKELGVIKDEIPLILKAFARAGLAVNWWLTFNRSYLDSRIISANLEDDYKKMIMDLFSKFYNGDILFLDWENDVLGGRSQPDERVLKNFREYIKPERFEIELERWRRWEEEQTDFQRDENRLVAEAKYQIACEAKEGEFLSGSKSPFGSEGFILVPLELPERFDNFTIFVPDFKKRVVPVLSCYPWRLN